MKKMNKKGFTLIELLAVIVILGLLMAIAIPSVTKYINESRKKTLVGTIGNLIQAVSTDVNNGDYAYANISDGNTYAIPIECIALEKGGQKTPFGAWDFAYVYVRYDGSNSYNYWFTFKSAGYGMDMVAADRITKDSIRPNSNVSKPTNISAPGNSLIVLSAVTPTEENPLTSAQCKSVR